MKTLRLLLLICFAVFLQNAHSQEYFFEDVDDDGWLNFSDSVTVANFMTMSDDSIVIFHPRSEREDDCYKPLINNMFKYETGLNLYQGTDVEYGTESIPNALHISMAKDDECKSGIWMWDYSGGITFKLPSCFDFQMVYGFAGKLVLGIYTSTDLGFTWEEASVPEDGVFTLETPGQYIHSITDSVPSVKTTSPIWVKIVNGSIAPLRLHKIKIITSEFSTNATLSELTLSEGTLEPEFDGATYDYTAELPLGTTITPTVTATTANTNATVDVTDAVDVTSEDQADRTTTIVVTAEDGDTQLTYSVVFNVSTNSVHDDLSSDIFLYPNPASSKLYISHAEKIERVVIYNITGRKVFTQNTINTEAIDISDLNSGLYFISVFDVNDNNIISKFHKQ